MNSGRSPESSAQKKDARAQPWKQLLDKELLKDDGTKREPMKVGSSKPRKDGSGTRSDPRPDPPRHVAA